MREYQSRIYLGKRGRRKYTQARSRATWEMWGKARWKMEGDRGGTKSRLATEKHREKVQDTGNEGNPQKTDFKKGLRPAPT